MRIALVTHNVIRGDGQGRVNYEVVQEALRRGHRLSLVATRVAEDIVANPSITWTKVPVAGWPTQLLKNQVFAWQVSRWLRRRASDHDVVMACGFVCWNSTDVNAVHLVHGAWRHSPAHTARVRSGPYAWYHWINSWLNEHLEKHAFDRSSVLIAVSGQVRRELLDLGVLEEKVHLITNGVDLAEFAPGPNARESLSLPLDVPLALFVGDIRSPLKNLETVLHALLRLPSLHLAVAGSTKGSPYPKMAHQMGIRERVHFLGFRRDIPNLMRASDMFVLPSRYESFSLVVLEAMASGLPIVTASTVGASDIITAETGIVILDPESDEVLAHAMSQLVDDVERRKQMGRCARRTALDYSFDQMARRYIDLLEELATQASEGHAANLVGR